MKTRVGKASTHSVSVHVGAAIEKQEEEIDKFSKVEKQRSVSPEVVVRRR